MSTKQMQALETTIAELSRRVEELEKGKQSKKVKNATSKENKPKRTRAPTGYNLFVKEMNDQAREMLDEENKSQQAVMTKVGELWRELESEQRTYWNDKARGDASGSSGENDN